MSNEVMYQPTSFEMTQVINKSCTAASNIALSKHPKDQAKRLHTYNIKLLTEAMKYIRSKEDHERVERTIANLLDQLDKLDEVRTA
jgi:hypothetical protein